ncbi:accessory gene regulator B family protein [Lutispora thermophila]|uniref:Accessory gene regulator B n=1 Tax=Lutispora thermophila DSM 19022 TaxID=1122184 RepID=A0A1M6DPQ2_9FIRM|nr:accessory gene regulator B family protein [Lutispora thermophila]SHI75109.1 accessory gene regulator B [Lutispora thermophila DSM 19022]
MDLINKIADGLIANGAIKVEDRDLYEYGLKQGLLIIVNILTTIAIGLLFNMVWQSLLFMIAYIPLRSFAGGYHARTQSKCYFFSILLTMSVLLAIKLIPCTRFNIVCIAMIAAIIIYALAPVEDANKPLDKMEEEVYKKRARKILAVELCAMLLAMGLRVSWVSFCISVSILALSILIIIGKVKNFRSGGCCTTNK